MRSTRIHWHSLIAESRALGNDLAPVFLAAWKVIEHKTAQSGEDV